MDHYKILEVGRDVTSDDIKAAYKQLAIRWHPDKNLNNVAEAEAKFKQISEAYQVGVLFNFLLFFYIYIKKTSCIYFTIFVCSIVPTRTFS